MEKNACIKRNYLPIMAAGLGSPLFFDSGEPPKMRTTVLSSILAITFSCSAALAHEPNQMDNANRALDAQASAARESMGLPADPAQPCVTLDMLKADLKGGKLVQLNPGQFHFMMGVYSGTAPVGPPPNADAAYLGRLKKKSFIVWMMGNCIMKENAIMPIPDGMVGVIKSIGPATNEKYDGYSDDSQDLHL